MSETTQLTPPCSYLPGVPGVPVCQLPPGTCMSTCAPNAIACAPQPIPCPPEAVPIDGVGALGLIFLLCVLAGWIAIAIQEDRRRAKRPPQPRYPE